MLTLVGHPGRVFGEQEPLQCIADGSEKGAEKKAATRLLHRIYENHLFDLMDVIVCDALYADADFITTVPSYGIIPVMRSKQENFTTIHFFSATW